jgi:hypothetical protein
LNKAGHNESKGAATQELERRILHGVALEWTHAVSHLSATPRSSLQLPLFSLRDLKGQWGTWSRSKREISLSCRLVLNHPWDSVREVLLHEIAHQYVDEVLGSENGSPHGPIFQEACRLLRANPKSSGNYPLLDQRLASESVHSHDKTMIRVKKLMALAESKNRHEAEAAMAKAHELIRKYNLDLFSQENQQRDFISVFVGKPALRHKLEDYQLAHLLQDFYFVQGIWVSAYVVEKGKMGRALEINGTLQNLKIASYVHDFVSRFIGRQWAGYNLDKRLNSFRRSDFAVGVIQGFRSKLEQSKIQMESRNRFALVKMEDPLLAGYVAHRYPRLVTFRRGVSNQDKKVLGDGERVGSKLVISRGITEQQRSDKLLPEASSGF